MGSLLMSASKRALRSYPRAKGPAGQIDKTWKDTIRAGIEQQEMSITDYARKIGINPNSLFMALSENQRATRYKRQIMEGLGLVFRDVDEPEPEPNPDRVVESIEKVIRDLSIEDRELVLALAERLAEGH